MENNETEYIVCYEIAHLEATTLQLYYLSLNVSLKRAQYLASEYLMRRLFFRHLDVIESVIKEARKNG